MKTPRKPQDRRKYPRDARACVADNNLSDGEFVYVQDLQERIWVVPDGPHLHPKVLGGAEMALYAGTLSVLHRWIVELTNLSGTFRCDDDEGLLSVADWLEQHGISILPNAVRFFPHDGARPYILR